MSGRIIPAYAGSTYSVKSRDMRRKDHPRIRGEHSEMLRAAYLPGGSSPHTRGARRTLPSYSGRRRIIPAYAGSTLIAEPLLHKQRDHPRIRGEHGIGGRRRRT